MSMLASVFHSSDGDDHDHDHMYKYSIVVRITSIIVFIVCEEGLRVNLMRVLVLMAA